MQINTNQYTIPTVQTQNSFGRSMPTFYPGSSKLTKACRIASSIPIRDPTKDSRTAMLERKQFELNGYLTSSSS